MNILTVVSIKLGTNTTQSLNYKAIRTQAKLLGKRIAKDNLLKLSVLLCLTLYPIDTTLNPQHTTCNNAAIQPTGRLHINLYIAIYPTTNHHNLYILYSLYNTTNIYIQYRHIAYKDVDTRVGSLACSPYNHQARYWFIGRISWIRGICYSVHQPVTNQGTGHSQDRGDVTFTILSICHHSSNNNHPI